ncbi:hypothetical protein EA136_22805, partial [Enterobacter hormaechei subsp. hoffmannii]
MFPLNLLRGSTAIRGGLMSDPLTGTGAVLGGGLLGSVLYGVFTHTDFGVVFGAFGGAVFY